MGCTASFPGNIRILTKKQQREQAELPSPSADSASAKPRIRFQEQQEEAEEKGEAKRRLAHISKAVGRMSYEFGRAHHRGQQPVKGKLKNAAAGGGGLAMGLRRITSGMLRSRYFREWSRGSVEGGLGDEDCDDKSLAEQAFSGIAKELPSTEPDKNQLFHSCQTGNTGMVKAMLKAVAAEGVELPEGHLSAALCAAAANNRQETIRVFLGMAPDLRFDCKAARDDAGNTPLKIAALEGHHEAVQIFIDAGWDIEDRSNSGKTALLSAAEKGRLECVSLLISAGASLAATTGNAEGPVTLAARGGHLEVVEELLLNGGNVCEFSALGDTPLFVAVENNHPEVVQLLLEYGEGTDGRNAEGSTPLMVAAANGYVDVVHVLLEFNALIDDGDVDGDTPLWSAAKEGHVEVVRLLLQAGANVEKERDSGESPLWMAAYNGHIEVVKLLLDAGADVDCIDCRDVTPLMQAVSTGNASLTKLLLNRGADVNAVDFLGNACVVHAVLRGSMTIMKLLASAGASFDVQDAEGKDLLTIAEESHHRDIFHFVAERLGVARVFQQESLARQSTARSRTSVECSRRRSQELRFEAKQRSRRRFSSLSDSEKCLEFRSDLSHRIPGSPDSESEPLFDIGVETLRQTCSSSLPAPTVLPEVSPEPRRTVLWSFADS